MSTTRVDDIEDNVFHESGRINSTWGGNLVDMVRSAQYLRIIEAENLVENAAGVGEFFLEELHRVAAEFESISNVRGQGLMLAFDLPDGDSRDVLRTRCWDSGLATLTCGARSIRFRPCLTFSRDDVSTAIELLRAALEEPLG